MILHDFPLSSASFRVRIALNLKGLSYKKRNYVLRDGEQRAPEYLKLNPAGFVPALEIDAVVLGQSIAIIDYLDALYPQIRLIPVDPLARARTMEMVLTIACDIHPINNLRVLKYLKDKLGQDQAAIDDWYRHWIIEGFAALEEMAPEDGLFGSDLPNLADVCLVPQMANARRFDTPLEAFPKLLRIDAVLTEMPAFKAAHPDAVNPDA